MQIVRLVEQASHKTSRTEVLAVLDEMRRRRLIAIDGGGRWHLRGLQARPRSPGSCAPDEPGVPASSGRLPAVRARIRSIPDCALADMSDHRGDRAEPLPIGRLLSYYEATQRSDRRGPICQDPARHGHEYQLICATGQWWHAGSMLTIGLADLPARFRHALSTRNGNALVIGYPLAITVQDDMLRLIPVGLMSASLSRTGYLVEVTPQSTDIVANPDWIRLASAGEPDRAAALAQCFHSLLGLSLQDFCERLSDCQAAQLAGPLLPDSLAHSIDPAVTGIRNAAAVFLPAEASFTDDVAADLGRLAKMPEARLAGTAMWHLFHAREAAASADVNLNPVHLTPSQSEAAERAINGRVTAITAPPGTGKRDVIVSIIASALATDKTVLFASRDHRAIDALEERLVEVAQGHRILVRADHRDGDRDTDFMSIIDDLDSDGACRLPARTADSLERLRNKAAARATATRNRASRKDLQHALAEHVRRRDQIISRLGERDLPSETLWRRLFGVLPFRRASPPAQILPPGAGLDELEASIRRDKKALARIAVGRDPAKLGDDIAAGMKELFPALAAGVLTLNSEDRRMLKAERARLELTGRTSARDMTEYVGLQVLLFRPVWVMTPSCVPRCVPLEPGIFDYVIIDDADQSDIASALPLLARAKRAVIIGDPNQPARVHGLKAAHDRRLMAAADLPLPAMGQLAQGGNSLFAFCAGRPGTGSAMLRDQFRSAPAIVSYLSEAFYDGQMRAMRKDRDVGVTPPAAAGLFWTDIPGRTSLSPAGQPQNHAEAEAILRYLDHLLGEQKCQGTIGVISLFGAQAALLRGAIETAFPKQSGNRVEINIAIVDGFPAVECDTVLFSLVAGPGPGQGACELHIRDERRFNAAVSRARTAAHIFGNLSFARESGIRHLAMFADSATGLAAMPAPAIAGRNLELPLFGGGDEKPGLKMNGRRWLMDFEARHRIDERRRDHRLKSRRRRVRALGMERLARDMEERLDPVE